MYEQKKVDYEIDRSTSCFLSQERHKQIWVIDNKIFYC